MKPIPTEDIEHFMQEHIQGAQAAIVVDGSADELIAQLLAAGWTWADRPSVHCAGKRVRYLHLPEERR